MSDYRDGCKANFQSHKCLFLLFNKSLFITYNVPGTLLGPENRATKKRQELPPVTERRNLHKKKNEIYNNEEDKDPIEMNKSGKYNRN